MINHLAQEISTNVNVNTINQQAQKEAITFAKDFWSLVLAKQTENFNQPSVDEKGNAIHRCQFQPWSQVVPLFDDGYDKTVTSLKLLKSRQSQEALVLQQKALRQWQKALDILKNPPPQQFCHTPKQQQEEQEEQQTDSSWDTSIEEVLRLLQRMEQDDRQKKTPGVSGRGSQEKPW